MDTCNRCGATLADAALHAAWHEALGAVIEEIDNSINYRNSDYWSTLGRNL